MSTGGALLQLVALGVSDYPLVNRNVSYEYTTYESEISNPILLPRGGDIIFPEYLELTFSNSERNNLDDVKNLVLIMSIGGACFETFPLSLLINLNEPILCDGKMYINLCFDMFFGDIKRIGLDLHEVKFKFIVSNALSCISRYGIVSKLAYLENNERRQLAENSQEEFIQQISFINVMSDLNDTSQTSNVYDLKNLPFEFFSKGFFIECANVDNLNNIYLKFNEEERFNLNRFLITTKCKKINQNMLYFPFNYDKEYSDRSANSYEGSPNLSRIDNITLRLNFDDPINNVKIYNLYKNFYRQMHGFGGLSFTPNFNRENIDLRNYPYDRESHSRELNRRYNGWLQPPLRSQTLETSIPQVLGTSIIYTGPTNKPIMIVDVSNCPIACEEIALGGKYMSCNQCKNNFSEQAIKQWLEGRRMSQRTCPLCRVHWSNYEIYINGEEEQGTIS
jgi:hypothetical protein